jgi:hypothetical protein
VAERRRREDWRSWVFGGGDLLLKVLKTGLTRIQERTRGSAWLGWSSFLEFAGRWRA